MSNQESDVTQILANLSETAVKEELARRKLARFLELESGGAWKSAPHLELLCNKLEAVDRGEIRRLIVCMPPRHGKSEVVSKKFPAWFLGRNPDAEIILTGYAAELSFDFSYIARNTLREWGPRLWGVDIAKDAGATGRWRIADRRGGVVAAGVGGAITGRGARVAIIDDPFKSWEDALSENQRRLVWEWYQTTLRTRLTPDGTIILVMTRWHTDDLVGRMIDHMRNPGVLPWEIINLPAISIDNDPLDRMPGEPLWPARYPLTNLEETRADMGPLKFGAMYQQDPQSLDNAVFKAEWINWYTQNMLSNKNDQWYFLDEPLMIYGGIDLAMSSKTNSDEFCFATVGRTSFNKIIVLETVQGHFDPSDQYRVARECYQRWHHQMIEVETNQGQIYFYDTLVKELPLFRINHTSNKYARIANLVPIFEQGVVYFREAMETEAFYEDPFRIMGRKIHHQTWPLYEQTVQYNSNITHDDRIDALEMALDAAKTGKSEIIVPQTQNRMAINPINDGGLSQAIFGRHMTLVEQKPGDFLPSPIVPKGIVDPKFCPECLSPYIRRRGINQYYCTTHGWSGESGLPQGYTIVAP